MTPKSAKRLSNAFAGAGLLTCVYDSLWGTVGYGSAMTVFAMVICGQVWWAASVILEAIEKRPITTVTFGPDEHSLSSSMRIEGNVSVRG